MGNAIYRQSSARQSRPGLGTRVSADDRGYNHAVPIASAADSNRIAGSAGSTTMGLLGGAAAVYYFLSAEHLFPGALCGAGGASGDFHGADGRATARIRNSRMATSDLRCIRRGGADDFLHLFLGDQSSGCSA